MIVRYISVLVGSLNNYRNIVHTCRYHQILRHEVYMTY